MLKLIIMGILILINIILSGSVFTQLQLFGVSPDIFICLIASILCIENRVNSILFALIGGIALDIIFADMIGFYTLQYFLASVVMYYIAQRLYRGSFIFVSIIAAIGVLVKEFVVALIVVFMDYSFSFFYLLVSFILPSMLTTAAIVLLIHYLIKQIYKFKFMTRRATTEFLDNL